MGDDRSEVRALAARQAIGRRSSSPVQMLDKLASAGDSKPTAAAIAIHLLFARTAAQSSMGRPLPPFSRRTDGGQAGASTPEATRP